MKRQRDEEQNEEDENKRRKIIIQLNDGVLSVVERVENDSGEVTALHIAALKGHVAFAKVLLQSGADVNAVGEEKWTALHFTAEDGHIDVVKMLLENGADMECSSERFKAHSTSHRI